MQKTTFNFEIIIGDDCSTDGTLNVIKGYLLQYPDKIKILTNVCNIGMIPNFYNTLMACNGKYIAFCEGDDYWTDEYKLQKQVDFLEKNTDYGIVHTNIDIFYNTEGRMVKYNSPRLEGYIFKTLLRANQIKTLTVVARKNLVLEALESSILNVSQLLGDYPLWLEISFKNKIKFINESTGAYRKQDESAYNTRNKQKQFLLEESLSDIQKYFAEKYDCMNVIRKQLVNQYRNHLFHAAMNNVPQSGKKAYTFIKKYDRISMKDFLLFILSQYTWFFKLMKVIKTTNV